MSHSRSFLSEISEDYPAASVKITTFECLKKSSNCTFFAVLDRLTIIFAYHSCLTELP